MNETPKSNDADLPPWEEEGAIRRDAEPHRSGLLLGLARGSLALGLMALCVWWLAPAGLLLGIAALVVSRLDLAQMARGEMDAAGDVDAEAALRKATYGLILCVAALALWGAIFYLTFAPGR